MGRSRILAAAALSALLAAPVAAQAASPFATTHHHTTASAPHQGGMIDINTASARQLDTLPGIGRKRARMIIAHRPYKAKDDLVTRKIIPKNVYNQIQNQITIH